MDLNAVLPAGETLVRPAMAGHDRQSMGQPTTRLDDFEMAVVEGPWGRLRVMMTGYPVAMRVQLDGEYLAALLAIGDGVGSEGPVPTYKDRDSPLVLGEQQGGVRFVAEGIPKLAGRTRYERATIGDEIWTYGRSETLTDRPSLAGKLLGSLMAATQLRRGRTPSKGVPVAGITPTNVPGDKITHGLVGWQDGTQFREILLILLMWLGTDEGKLDPLWTRTLFFGGNT